MPITEAEMPYEDMKKSADTHRCACGGRLNIAWGGSFGYDCYILRCSENIEHKTITRHSKKQEDYENLRREVFKLDTKSLQTMTETQMITRIDMAKFPQDLTKTDKKMLAEAAISYGFDPLMGEISVYQGRPFISIDGRYRKAQETGLLDGVETRPATKQEREDWQIPEGDYFFRAEIYVKNTGHPFIGWGRVRKSEMTGGKGYKPVETNPQRMAEKRAEAQALRKAFHIPLPSIEDIGNLEEQYVQPEYDIDSTARIVDEETGEITENEPVPERTESNSTEQKPESKGNDKLVRDPASIKSITDLQKACQDDFGMKRADCLKELNIASWPDLAITPAEAYEQIKSVR
jgi:hypothetical protein